MDLTPRHPITLLLILFSLVPIASGANASDDPLPPIVIGTQFDVLELDTIIFAIPFEDPNPNGSGGPHTFHLASSTDGQGGTMYQVEEDGVTLGDVIFGFDVPITNSQGLIAFQTHYMQTGIHYFSACVTNAYGLTSCAGMFINVIPINHPPVAHDQTTMIWEQYPVAEVIFSYSDPNGDPLMVTLLSIPEQGDLYADAVAPENLVTEPGTFAPGTKFYFDSGVEVDMWQPAGHSYFASFQYFVSDHEFDSPIATNTLRLLRVDWGPEVWAEPSLVTIAPSEEYVEFQLVMRPYLTVPSHFVVSKAPEVGEFGFDMLPDSESEWWVWMDSVVAPGQPIPGLHAYPDGTYRVTLRYRHGGAPPTTPDDADMELHFLIGSIGEMHFPPGTPAHFTVTFEVLPYSCNPQYIEANCCHHSCWPCVSDCECIENDATSLYFDGNERYIDLGIMKEFGPAMNHGSVEMWIRTNRTDIQLPLIRLGEASTGVPGTEFLQYFDIVLNVSGSNLFARQFSWFHSAETVNFYSLNRLYPTADLTDDRWHHIVVQFNTAANDIELFIDGELRPFASQTGSGGSGSMLPFTMVSIGLGTTTSSSDGLLDFYIGHMREVRFWNVLRTQDEIIASMNGEFDPKAPGLFGYWPLDEGAGSVAMNLADPGGAHDGMLMNQPWWIISEPENCAPDCIPADLNCDGVIDIADLLIILANWGACADCTSCIADLNGSCSVDIDDLLLLLTNWG